MLSYTKTHHVGRPRGALALAVRRYRRLRLALDRARHPTSPMIAGVAGAAEDLRRLLFRAAVGPQTDSRGRVVVLDHPDTEARTVVVRGLALHDDYHPVSLGRVASAADVGYRLAE